MRIYHYTTIDTLALILKNKTIRFNRLDKMDDLHECAPDITGFKHHNTFVSCWTDSEEEDVAQWKMYAQGTGVRISMDSDMFKNYDLYGDIATSEGRAKKCAVPYCDAWGSKKDYMVWPIYTDDTECFFCKVNYEVGYNKKPRQTRRHEGNGILVETGKIAKTKDDIWRFQSEVRYILQIYKNYPLRVQTNDKYAEFKSIFASSMLMSQKHIENEEPPISEYFLHLKDNAFDSLEVTLYPGCTESHKIIVDSLLKEYAPHVKAKPSELEGKVRLK